VNAGDGQVLKGLHLSCAPFGCGKYAQPGPNYEERKNMPTSRSEDNTPEDEQGQNTNHLKKKDRAINLYDHEK